MTRIFISYSRTDEMFARQVATALSDLGADIWIDIEDIPAGMKWSSAIQQGLDTADALIVIITPEAMSSRNVEDEWQYFLDHNKPVIPIFLRPAKIHFQLNRIQWVDFRDQSFDVALMDLYHEFKRNGITISRPPNPKVDAPSHSHGHAPPPAPKPVQQQQSTQTNRLPMIIGGVVVGLILLGVIGMSLLSNNNNDPDAQNTLVAQENRIASLEAQTQAVADLVEQQETLMFISTLTAEALASATEPATNTPTDVPIYLGPVTNNDWTPYERDFDGVTMVLVPSGEFTFGASQAQLDANIAVCQEKLNEASCEALRDELNGRIVTIDEPYWIDKYEVSQAQYGSSSSDNPQVDVTSEQAQAFCQARDASLPSEAQWEFAAKGPEGWRYPWGDTWDLSIVRSNICDANCTENWREADYDDGYARLSPVNEIHGSESWIGAWNMVGNVWEWTSDVYSDETTNVLRGGAWTWIQAESTTTSRAAGIAATTSFYGFRCVRPYSDGDLNP